MPLARPAAALLATAVLTGCGGSGPVARIEGERVEIRLDDFLVAPQEISAGRGELTFAVRNGGRLGHNFRVRDEEGEHVEITTLLPGEDATQAADLEPGRYTMLCTVANHEQLGMTGRLVVR